MADVLPDLTLIVTNPDLSGRSLKIMTLLRLPNGTFGVDEAYPDVTIGDGLTTLVRIPLGARMVISEAHEPPMSKEMAVHPAVTGESVVDALPAIEEDTHPLPSEEAHRELLVAEEADLEAMERAPDHRDMP